MKNNEQLNEIINSYTWIKVKKYTEENSGNPIRGWEKEYLNLLKHHKKETKFLIATCRELAQQLLNKEEQLKYQQFDENDWAHLHDVILSATGKISSREELIEFYKTLPVSMQHLAEEWGMNDTVFRDNVYEHLIFKDNVDEHLSR